MPNTLPVVPVVFDHTYKTNGDAKETFARINNTADFVNLFSFDNLGRLTQVVQRQFTGTEQTNYGTSGTNTLQRKRFNLAYNAAGQFSKIVRSAWIGSGDTEVATSEYVYFNGGGLKALGQTHSGHLLGSTPPSGPLPAISTYSWTYDTAGRVASFTAPEGTFAYGYDATHQLTSATFTVDSSYSGGTPPTENFNFDATGNRTGSGSSIDKNRLVSAASMCPRFSLWLIHAAEDLDGGAGHEDVAGFGPFQQQVAAA